MGFNNTKLLVKLYCLLIYLTEILKMMIIIIVTIIIVINNNDGDNNYVM